MAAPPARSPLRLSDALTTMTVVSHTWLSRRVPALSMAVLLSGLAREAQAALVPLTIYITRTYISQGSAGISPTAAASIAIRQGLFRHNCLTWLVLLP
jgi:hypothetical protein